VASELDHQIEVYAEVGVFGETPPPDVRAYYDTDLTAHLYDTSGTLIWPG